MAWRPVSEVLLCEDHVQDRYTFLFSYHGFCLNGIVACMKGKGTSLGTFDSQINQTKRRGVFADSEPLFKKRENSLKISSGTYLNQFAIQKNPVIESTVEFMCRIQKWVSPCTCTKKMKNRRKTLDKWSYQVRITTAKSLSSCPKSSSSYSSTVPASFP